MNWLPVPFILVVQLVVSKSFLSAGDNSFIVTLWAEFRKSFLSRSLSSFLTYLGKIQWSDSASRVHGLKMEPTMNQVTFVNSITTITNRLQLFNSEWLFSPDTKLVNKLHSNKEFRIVVRKGEFLFPVFKISPDRLTYKMFESIKCCNNFCWKRFLQKVYQSKTIHLILKILILEKKCSYKIILCNFLLWNIRSLENTHV